ncbi:MAG: hypothetical protein ABEJ61_09975 [Haloferacaceae archaeon]
MRSTTTSPSRVAEWADLLGASVPETARRQGRRDDASPWGPDGS